MKIYQQLGRACAKVNLHLNVFDKKEDGYHQIISVFQKINMFDEILVKLILDGTNEENIIKVSGLEGICEPLKDSMSKAALFFSKKFSIILNMEIKIVKNIPHKSGLGGASSDAAFILSVLNKVYNKTVDQEYLTQVAYNVGADVPFFLSEARAAIVEGIGEIITPIAKPKNFFGFVLMPKSKDSSTVSAYKELDEKGLGKQVFSKQELIDMYNNPVPQWKFFNEFEKVVPPASINRPKTSFYTLSGSGSSSVLINTFFAPYSFDFDGQIYPILFL